MRLRNITIFISGILIMYSCDSNEKTLLLEDEISDLTYENLAFKRELDSVKIILENENLTPYVFNNSFGIKSKNLDSLDFLVCIGYNRPNYSQTIYLDVFINEDSLNFAHKNPEQYEFSYQYDLQDTEKPETGIQVKLPNLKGDFVALGGVIKNISAKGIKYLPFQYEIDRK